MAPDWPGRASNAPRRRSEQEVDDGGGRASNQTPAVSGRPTHARPAPPGALGCDYPLISVVRSAGRWEGHWSLWCPDVGGAQERAQEAVGRDA